MFPLLRRPEDAINTSFGEYFEEGALLSLVLRAAVAAVVLSIGAGWAQDSSPRTSAPCAAIVRSSDPNVDEKLKALDSEAEGLKLRIAPLPDGGEKNVLSQKLRDLQGTQLDLLFEQECARTDLAIQAWRGPTDPPVQWIEITTYYATNRKATGDTAPDKFFGADRVAENQFGKTIVSIPTLRQPGELNLPSLWRFETSPDPSKHFVFKQVVPLDSAGAMAEIAKVLASVKKSSLLVFVHGYNVSFTDAALRTAQLAHDLAFPGTAIFFSWPSAATTKGYWRDEETVQLSEAAFDAFLDKVSESGASDVFLIAHSMGNRLVTTVLKDRAAKGKSVPNLRELMLAAPDINAEIFREKIIPALAALKLHRTIYASSSDVALRASKVVHDYRRVGETAGGVQTFQGFETVDATAAAPVIRSFGHSYVVDSTKVLGDIADTMYLRFNADQRSLPKQGTPPENWWVLK